MSETKIKSQLPFTNWMLMGLSSTMLSWTVNPSCTRTPLPQNQETRYWYNAVIHKFNLSSIASRRIIEPLEPLRLLSRRERNKIFYLTGNFLFLEQ